MSLFQPYYLIFALAEEREHRLTFSFPRRRLLLLALAFAGVGFACLHPILADDVNLYLRLFAGGGSFLLAATIGFVAVASEGALVIDAIARCVRFHFDSPRRKLSWVKPFEDFQQVQFAQVVDGHGLHNHWRIELRLQDGSTFRLGYGLLGTVRRSAADSLTKKVSELMRIPVVQLDNR